MIGKVVIGKSFRGCLLYCLNDKIKQSGSDTLMKDRAEVLMYNQCYGSQKELIQQFNEVRQLNLKLSKPVMHITLSLAPGENLSRDKLMEMAQACAKEMDFENNQYVAVLHRDTNHQHIHIVANRIGFDKRTVSDSNSYRKIANYCRKMEIQYNLRQVISPRQFLPRGQRVLPRLDQRKELLRQHIQQALKESRHFQEFERKMEERGYQVVKGRGVSFVDNKKVKVKGSELNYSLQTIELILKKQRILGLKHPSGSGLQPFPNQHQASRQSNPEQGKQPCSEGKIIGLPKSLSTIIEQVIKPEETNEQPAHELLQHKRKKKIKRSHHL